MNFMQDFRYALRPLRRCVGGATFAMTLSAGMAAVLAVGRVIASQLHGVGAADPFVLAGVAAVLVLVALAACAIPTFRASRVAHLADGGAAR